MITVVTRQEFEDALDKDAIPLMAVWIALDGQAPQTCAKRRSIRKNCVIQFATSRGRDIRFSVNNSGCNLINDGSNIDPSRHRGQLPVPGTLAGR